MVAAARVLGVMAQDVCRAALRHALTHLLRIVGERRILREVDAELPPAKLLHGSGMGRWTRAVSVRHRSTVGALADLPGC